MLFEKLLPMGTAIPTLFLPPTDAARVKLFARQRCGARSSRLAPHSFGLSRLGPNTVRALPLSSLSGLCIVESLERSPMELSEMVHPRSRQPLALRPPAIAL